MRTNMVRGAMLACVGLLGLAGMAWSGGCEDKKSPTEAGTPVAPVTPQASGKPTRVVVGVIAKSQQNPVFQAARTGALDAAKDLSAKYGVEIVADWQTPTQEDAQRQASIIEQLVSKGVDGIAISCTDGQVVRGPIDAAVARGVVVVTFDSDSPDSKRMAYYGINDVDAGRAVMRELAKAMGTGGPVAVLSGTQTAPNLNARIRGVREELETLKDRGFTLKEVYYTREDAAAAAGFVQQVQTSNPDIAGWAMVGGWPLFTQNALNGIADRGVKVVSVDHLPAQLEYVRRGEVQALIGQDCYGWGYESVRMIVEKLLEGKTPANEIVNFELKIVTKENVGEFEGLWDRWLGRK